MRRWPRSATLRLAALVFSLQLVGAGVMLTLVRQITRGQVVADARADARRQRDELIGIRVRLGEAGLRDALAAVAPDGAVLLVDARGRYLGGNVAAWPPTAPAGRGEARIVIFRAGRSAPDRLLVIATPLPRGERLLTGSVIEEELRVTEVLETALAAAMALAVTFAALAAWLATRTIEARLRRTVATARAVAAGDLDRRVPADGSDDAFAALGEAVNAMLDRIVFLVAELKVATDGLAHDLRSPLTRMRAALERALAQVADETGRAALARALDEGDRLLAILDTALRITRAEAGVGREAIAPVDVAGLARDLAEAFGPVAEDRGLALETDLPSLPPVPADRDLLGQAIANLLDNAIKYGAGTVRVTAERRDGETILTVADRGPGIPDERRAEALKRFGRLDPARGGSGAGLGLSLAAAVAHLHGGHLELADAAPGLIVRLVLPSPEMTETSPGARLGEGGGAPG